MHTSKATSRLVAAASCGSLIALIAFAGAGVVSGAGLDQAVVRGPSDLSIFRHDAVSRDRLPDFLLKSPTMARFSIPIRARRAFATKDGSEFFVVAGRGSSLCLERVHGRGRRAESAGTCSPTSVLRKRPILFGLEFHPGSRWLFTGVVPDGYDTVTSDGAQAKVMNNTFVIPARPTGKLAASGPAVAPLAISLESGEPVR
jgi:hypothetical protein